MVLSILRLEVHPFLHPPQAQTNVWFFDMIDLGSPEVRKMIRGKNPEGNR